MKRKLSKIQAGARREASKKAGAYDGRFGHRVFTDRKKEADRYLCREDVEYVESEQGDDFSIEKSSHRL